MRRSRGIRLSVLVLSLLVATTSLSAGGYRLFRVSDQIQVAVRIPILEYPVEGNVTIIINQHDVVLIDSPRTPQSARQVVKLIRSLTDKPVRYLVNTHWHGDHHHGNAVFAEAFPGLEIIGSRFAREEILTRGRASLESQIRRFRDRRGLRDSLKRVDLSDARRHRITQLLEIPEDYAEQLAQVKLTPPSLTYDRLLALHREGRRIQVRTFGPGNTRGDAVILLPDDRVVISGDLLVETVPFMSLSQPLSWLERLEEIAALDVDWIVPGHGQPMQDRAWLLRHMRLLRALVTQVEACLDDNQNLEECRKHVDLDRFREEYAQGDRSLQNEFDYRVTGPAVRDAYRESRARRFGLGPVKRSLLEGQAGELRARTLLLEGSFPGEQFKEWMRRLDRISTALDQLQWQLALSRLQDLQTDIGGYKLLSRAEQEKIDLATLEEWRRELLPNLDEPEAENSSQCAPLLICALVQESLNRGRRFSKASVQYGKVLTSPQELSIWGWEPSSFNFPNWPGS